jgi:flagellar export protein FliJ
VARDVLPVLARLRKLATDSAIRALAAAIQDEARLSQDLDAARTARVQEQATATSMLREQPQLIAFPAWDVRARRNIASIAGAHQLATDRLEVAKHDLGAARGAELVINVMADRRHAAVQTGRAREAQRELDDAGRRRPAQS